MMQEILATIFTINLVKLIQAIEDYRRFNEERDMTIGEKLQARRKELNLTQEAAAQQLHVSRQAISNWETGKNYPDLETIIAISDVYTVSLDTLLKGDTLIVKEINKTIYTSFIKKGILFLGLLSSVICLVVNLAIDQRLTWSFIPLISIGCINLIWLTFERATNQRLIKAWLCLSLLTLPYLWLLERILVNSQYIGSQGFFKLAAPISLIWLALLWLSVIIQLKRKWHWSYSVALFCLTAIGGGYLMNIVLNQTGNHLTTMINTITLGSLSLFFFYLGNVSQSRRSK